jgi:hypothetical protein
MARYAVKATRTASATLDVGSVINAAASPRRFQLFDLMFGSDATPADFAFLWEFFKRTGTATGGTAPTISPLDVSDTIASTLVANQAPTTNGAGGSTAPLLSVPLNQRASFRWVASPGSELVSPATASNGFAAATPTAGALVAVECTFLVNEL